MFLSLLIVIAIFLRKVKKNENEFFYIIEFEIGYVLMFSSVKISTYKYYKTNKTLSFIYHYRNKTCQNGRISPISMFSVGLLVGKSPFQDGAVPEKTALVRVDCQQVPKTHYSSAEHRRSHCNQDERSSSPHYAV